MERVAQKRLQQAFNLLQPFGFLDIPSRHSCLFIQGQHPEEDVVSLLQHKQHELVEDCAAGDLHGLVHLLLRISVMTR